MINSHLNRITTLGWFVLVLTLALAGSVAAQKDRAAKISIEPVRALPGGTIVQASGATLGRNSDGVFFTLPTQSLPVGNVISAWMAIFNNPEFCATSPCTAADFANPDVNGTPVHTGARIIGLDGSAVYGSYRLVGDATGTNGGGTGNGIVLPLSAEIHIVLRNHGPASADPDILQQQLTMFNGGCMGACTNIQAAVFQR